MTGFFIVCDVETDDKVGLGDSLRDKPEKSAKSLFDETDGADTGAGFGAAAGGGEIKPNADFVVAGAGAGGGTEKGSLPAVLKSANEGSFVWGLVDVAAAG